MIEQALELGLRESDRLMPNMILLHARLDHSSVQCRHADLGESQAERSFPA